MQKAIRFRDPENASYAACIGWDMSPTHVLRRLGVISLEDVGAGNLFGNMMALASLGNSAWRRRVGERRLAVWLADQLAQSPKDRTLCELCVLGNYDKGPNKMTMSQRSDQALIECASKRQIPLAHRMTAAWLLSGAYRFHDITVSRQITRTPARLIRLMVESGLPRAMIYIAHKAVSRLQEGMFVSLLFMHEMLSTTDNVVVHQPATFEARKVGALSGAAYDMHTREGLVALRTFAMELPVVRTFIAMVTPQARRRLIGFGVFLAEGARLASKLGYCGSDELTADAHRAELISPGLAENYHEPFLAAIADRLDELDAIRARVLRQADQRSH